MSQTTAPAQRAQQHIVGLDLLRFVAALMVMWFHYGYLASANQTTNAAKAAQNLLHLPQQLHATAQFGWVGVQIFFVISGFVIAFSGRGATPFRFFVSRVVRLVPGAWLCATITLAVLLVFGTHYSQEILWRGYRHSLMFHPMMPWIDTSFWTLAIEVAFYGCVFVLLVLNRFAWMRQLAIVLGLVSSVYWVAAAQTAIHAHLPLSAMLAQAQQWRSFDLLLIHHGMFFAIGILLWLELCDKNRRSHWFWIAVFAVTGCVQISSLAELAEAGAGRLMPLTLVASSIWLASLALMILAVRFNSRLLALPGMVRSGIRTMGTMTYPLYLVHQIAGCTLIGVLIRHGMPGLSAVAVVALLALVTAWVIATYLEPVLQKWMKAALLGCGQRFALSRSRG